MTADPNRLYAATDVSLMIVDTISYTELYIGRDGEGMLQLSSDGQTLMAWGSELKALDVSDDQATPIGEDCCSGCTGGENMSFLFSQYEDQIFLIAGWPRIVQVFDWQDNGLIHRTHDIPLAVGQYWNTGLVMSPNGSNLFVGFGCPWYGGGRKGLAFIRTYDFLPFRLEEPHIYVWDDGLVRNPSGTILAAAGGYYCGENDRVEIFDVTNPIANRGGFKIRPLDTIATIPVADAEVAHYSSVTGADSFFLDIEEGVLANTPVEAGSYSIEIEANGYESHFDTVEITAGNWTDLGNISMIRTGDLEGPYGACATPAVITGEISTVQIHGRSYHPNATLESVEPGIAINNSTWLDWATIEATIAVDPGLTTNEPISAFRVENPDGQDSTGKIFLLQGIDRVVSLASSTTVSLKQFPLSISRSPGPDLSAARSPSNTER